jgi:prepilin-type N-terminal cleavage/methylation domain-containing protein
LTEGCRPSVRGRVRPPHVAVSVSSSMDTGVCAVRAFRHGQVLPDLCEPGEPAGCRLDAGFTLIELLLVVATVGIIAAIAIPSLTRARGAAWVVSTVGSLHAIHATQVAYSVSCSSGVNQDGLIYQSSAPIASSPAQLRARP